MGCVLLIGNGINRCVSDDVSAGNLISFLSNGFLKDTGKDCKLTDCGEPFSLCFESILGKHRNIEPKDLFGAIKKKINDSLKDKENQVYGYCKSLNSLPDAILTTNYDFSIEKDWFGNLTKKSKALGKNRGYMVDCGIPIYHIHGDFNHEENICLGHVGYQKYLKSCTSNVRQNILTYKNGIFEHLESALPESLFLLLTHDVHIIGFSLSDCESVLWYMLTLRNDLKRHDIYNKEGIRENKIHYYVPYEKPEGAKDSIGIFFSNLGIDYVSKEIEDNQSYADYYEKLFEGILMK